MNIIIDVIIIFFLFFLWLLNFKLNAKILEWKRKTAKFERLNYNTEILLLLKIISLTVLIFLLR